MKPAWNRSLSFLALSALFLFTASACTEESTVSASPPSPQAQSGHALPVGDDPVPRPELVTEPDGDPAAALPAAVGDAQAGGTLAAAPPEPVVRPAREGALPAHTVRIGHLPNVTQAQALAAHARSRAGRGWYEQRLPAGTRVEWRTFPTGPAAMEALLADEIDVAYVGPCTALDAYARSKGHDVRLLAGATRGGAALVVPDDGHTQSAADLRGHKVATPELGGTQDVACRTWLAEQGLQVAPSGGDVQVVPMPSEKQLDAFQRGEVVAVWTVEPWVSLLEHEAHGKALVEQNDALTTVLVASARFLREQPELVRAVVAGNRELAAWLGSNGAEARELVRGELREETRREFGPELLESCWKRVRFDDSVAPDDLQALVRDAVKAGLSSDAGDLSSLMEFVR